MEEHGLSGGIEDPDPGLDHAIRVVAEVHGDQDLLESEHGPS
jgi:hypothetical protein